jgi:hypothetical protein
MNNSEYMPVSQMKTKYDPQTKRIEISGYLNNEVKLITRNADST